MLTRPMSLNARQLDGFDPDRVEIRRFAHAGR